MYHGISLTVLVRCPQYIESRNPAIRDASRWVQSSCSITNTWGCEMYLIVIHNLDLESAPRSDSGSRIPSDPAPDRARHIVVWERHLIRGLFVPTWPQYKHRGGDIASVECEAGLPILHRGSVWADMEDGTLTASSRRDPCSAARDWHLWWASRTVPTGYMHCSTVIVTPIMRPGSRHAAPVVFFLSHVLRLCDREHAIRVFSSTDEDGKSLCVHQHCTS